MASQSGALPMRFGIRIAPVFGVVFSRMSACGLGFPPAIVGQASRPSSGSLWSGFAPARASRVGYRSTACSGSVTTVPGKAPP